MDRTEMHKEFKLLMDKAGGGGAPSFISSEIDRFLNIAQDKFVSKRAFGNNPRRTGFEEDQKRRDDLVGIIRQSNLSSFNTYGANKPNAVLAPIPAHYRHAINEEAIIYTPGKEDSSRRVGVKPITHDRYNKIIDDPFNKPDKDTVYRLDFAAFNGSGEDAEGDPGFELICGEGQEISMYYIRYIRNPIQIAPDQNCMLSEHTHREIIRMAIVDALETIEQPRYQSSKIELNEIE